MQQLAQEDPVAQRLRQVEDHGRGPHHPVVGRQDLAVDEPAAALPPLLHGARGPDRLRAALEPKCSGRGASRPRARGSGPGRGFARAAPGPPLRRRASPPLPPPPPRAPLGPPLPPTCGRGAGNGQRAGSPRFTHASARGPRAGLHAASRRSAPRSAPPGAAFCAPGAPRPPPLLPRPRQRPGGVARSARPGPGPSASPPLCSPRPQSPRPALRLDDSAAQRLRGAGGAGGAATAGRGRGGAGALVWHLPAPQAPPPPPPPHFLPRYRPRKLRWAGVEAKAQVPATFSEGARTLGSPSPWGSDLALGVMAGRPSWVSLGLRGGQEVVPVALGALAWPFGNDRLGRGHRAGPKLPEPPWPIKPPQRDTRG